MSQPDRITTSHRDPAALGDAIAGWLAQQMPGTTPTVTDLSKPEGNGMSSDTILFTASWSDDGETVTGDFVARIEPELDDLPVFPRYDLGLQHRIMSLVATETAVPVPAPSWFEEDHDILGAPFFVMERFPGQVPKDNLPYTFPDDNFVITASVSERAEMTSAAATTLAAIHRITPCTHDLAFLAYDDESDDEMERHLAHWEAYKDWATEGDPSPLLEECFDWLWDEFPEDLGPARLSWGDARVGNMLFDHGRVSGVLDWEMAAIAPPEVDLGWMAYLHRFFQDLAEDLGAPGLPDFLRPTDLLSAYAAEAEWGVGDLRWPMAYAAMRHGVIMRRVGDRMVAFGERERPEDRDELILHRAVLREMLDGTYWDRVGL